MTLTASVGQQYVPQVATPDNGANPWQAVYDQGTTQVSNDSAMVTAETPGIQSSINDAQNAYNGYSAQSAAPGSTPSSYPSYQNSFGLGSQNAFAQSSPTPGSNASPSYATQPVTNTSSTTTSSSGFNPWSMQGESNAR